jgi:hypothetical protein
LALPGGETPLVAAENLALMDRLGIGTAILSLTGSRGVAGAGPPNREFARALNETAHRAVVDHPGRFGFSPTCRFPATQRLHCRSSPTRSTCSGPTGCT